VAIDLRLYRQALMIATLVLSGTSSPSTLPIAAKARAMSSVPVAAPGLASEPIDDHWHPSVELASGK